MLWTVVSYYNQMKKRCCHSNDVSDDDISFENKENIVGKMVKDLRCRLYRIPTENDIKITVGQTFNTI